MRPFVPSIETFLVQCNATIGEVVQRIDKGAVGICLIVDENRNLLATITDGDIRRSMLMGHTFSESAERLLEAKAKLTAHRRPVTSLVSASDEALRELMTRHEVQHIPLLDEEGRVVDVALLPALVDKPENDIQAVVMAGGFGTRLRPFTDSTPKPMLPVGDKPLLERTIDHLRNADITDVNITTHYLPEQITDHFGSGEEFGVKLNYVQEDQPLGTAGALGLMGRPDKTTLVINGDIVTTVNFRAMADFHRGHDADLTVAVRLYEVKVPYGVVESDGVHVTELREKPSFKFFVNAGIYLIEPHVWDLIQPGERLDMTTLIDRLLAKGKSVINFPLREYWLDVGQPDDYRRAQDDAQSGRLDL